MRDIKDIQEIRFLNKHFENRRIKVIFSFKEIYYIDNFKSWFCVDYCDYETHELLRKIALENIYWLLGLDEADESSIEDKIIETEEELKNDNIKHFNHLYKKYDYIHPDECEYICQHFLDDFYKNFNKYPYAVDILKLIK